MSLQQPRFYANAIPHKVSPVDGGGAGPPGQNAYTVTTADFIQPSVGSNVLVSVENSGWIGIESIAFVDTGGYYLVDSVPSATEVVLKNLGYLGNAPPGDTIPLGSLVGPGGLQGPAGPAGPTGQAVIRLACQAVNLPGASVAELLAMTYYPGTGIVAPYLIEEEQTISDYRVSLCSGFADNRDNEFFLAVSTDNGNSFLTTSIAILPSGSAAQTGTFAPITLNPGDLLYGYMQRGGGVGNLTTGILMNLK